MKIGYITKQHPSNRRAYSGTHYYMFKALKQSFEEVVPFGPVDSNYKIIPKAKGRLLRMMTGKVYKYQYDIGLAKRMAAIIDQKIAEHQPDALLASLMNPEMAYVKSDVPFYLTSDATSVLLNEVYGSHSNLHPLSVKEAMHLERKAFDKATKLILPLQWLADSAMKDYGVPSSKIEVIPYGANLDTEISEDEVEQIIKRRQESSKIKLLFVGIRWEEKGGPFAVKVLRSLLEKGIDAELYIVGCKPEIPNQPEGIKTIGFVDKETEQGRTRLDQLYKEATFFIMPTQAECVGMSFIEAASYALPAIGSETGGVPEAVVDNETGLICGPSHSPDDVADWIIAVRKEEKRYTKLSQQAYDKYRHDMNWENWSKRVRDVIDNEMGKG
ncbi:glycosyltransferase family 4 protein [Gracilimonas sp. BCB1]|uniref:glycosyltransferase family 4 protein n=1 Tax=Gracilimonas sp. BCB1 TaxID=3152362 RepID=UPI0032D99263